MPGKVQAEILFDGDPIGPISSLVLDQSWNNHHSFSITCPLREQKDSLLNLSQKYIGKEATIKLFAGTVRNQGELIFKGLLTNVQLSKQEGAMMQIIYHGMSPTIVLDDGPHHQSFLEKKVKDITNTVLDKFSIDTEVKVQYEDVIHYCTQYGETAYQFLSRLYATYGEWFYYDGQLLRCGSVEEGETKSLVFGRDMTGLELSLQLVPHNFKLLGYHYIDHSHNESPSAKVKVDGLDKLGELAAKASEQVFTNEPTIMSLAEASDKSLLDHYSMQRKSSIMGRLVNLYGNSEKFDLRIGEIIEVSAIGKTLGALISEGTVDYGNFRLMRITHQLDGLGNYENSFQGISADLKQPPYQLNKSTPRFAEMQIGEVTDNKDPEELGRVQIQFPWQVSNNDHSPWLRVTGSGAGGSHGAYFVPEIGDQVLIGFEHNNPDRPYVMGSMYHGKSKPAGLADPDNNSKVIKTRSGNQILLSDKSGEESITIQNGHNTIVLNLSGSGSVTISTDGDLSLSAKNININASEKLAISSGKETTLDADKAKITTQNGLEVSGGTKVEVTATDISLTAEKAIKAEGGATADMSSPKTTINGDATTTVKGGMVQLNP